MPHHPFAGQPYLDVEKLRIGDVTSFHSLYQQFYNEFLSKAVSMLNEDQKEEAIPLVQHCFIKCWLRSEALTSMNYVLAFLNTSVRKNCMACNVSNGFRSVHYSNILGAVLTDSVRGSLTRKELLLRITHLIADEIGTARQVFGRFYGRRMTISQIAKEMILQPESAQNFLNIAFQVLHLILSMENI